MRTFKPLQARITNYNFSKYLNTVCYFKQPMSSRKIYIYTTIQFKQTIIVHQDLKIIFSLINKITNFLNKNNFTRENYYYTYKKMSISVKKEEHYKQF